MNTRYLIIGGGVAGTTAAETLRKLDPEGSIAVVSDEPHPFYSRIGLSKANYFLGLVPEEEMFLKKMSWYEENRIDFYPGRKATTLDTAQKTATLDDGTMIRYQKLLLAVGSCARPFAAFGSNKKGIFGLRTLDDARAIIAAAKGTQRAVCIGGGFISFETCEILLKMGLAVTLIIREPYYWAGMLDQDSGKLIEDALVRGGVEVLKNEEVAEFWGDDRVAGLITKSARKIECELVVAGIGVFCPVDFVAKAGVTVEHGILANEYLETNIPDVWVAGDAAEFYDVVLNERVMLGNWVNAQIQGRIAAQNMAGTRTKFSMVSFYTTQGFGITIAFVGNVRVMPQKEVIARGSRELGWVERFILEADELEGATMVNRTTDMGAISKLIFTDANLAVHKKELADPSFDLKKLLVS